MDLSVTSRFWIRNWRSRQIVSLKASKSNPKQLGANIPGIVGNVLVKEGDTVKVNTPLLTLEAMKMETIVVSTIEGVVDKIYVKPGETVHQDDLMMSFQ